MELGHGGRHVGIAFVGAHYNVACLSHTEVAARHSCSSLHKLIAQVKASAAGEIGRVVVALFLAYAFLLEHTSHFLTLQVDGRHYYVAWFLFQQLKDALAKVGLHNINAVLLKERIHGTLLCEHRLRLYHLLHPMLPKNVEHNMVEVIGSPCPVHNHSSALKLRGELLQIVGKMSYGVSLYLAGMFSKLFPFGQPMCHSVAILS